MNTRRLPSSQRRIMVVRSWSDVLTEWRIATMSWVFALDDVALISWICWDSEPFQSFRSPWWKRYYRLLGKVATNRYHTCTMHRLNDDISEALETAFQDFEPIKYHFWCPKNLRHAYSSVLFTTVSTIYTCMVNTGSNLHTFTYKFTTISSLIDHPWIQLNSLVNMVSCLTLF